MLVGIDVGGTFTDGVLYHEGEIIKTAKQPTVTAKLQDSILQVLDELLAGINEAEIKRVVLSTTLVTNLLAAGQEEQVALVLIPGPGLNLRRLQLFPATFILKGAIDFRGRIIEPLVQTEIAEVAAKIKAQGYRQAAVVGKFSSRNHQHEEQVAQILQEKIPYLRIVKGHKVSGQLNFLRRLVTAYYTAATKTYWAVFAREIESALQKRGIKCPLQILKADGGTMPLPVSLEFPCETVFSGPAASVMGAFALTRDRQTSVVVDIGGTTSDLALILAGEPLHASRGARINGRYSSVRAFAVRSIPLGGDSAVRRSGTEITLGPDRLGPAACFGGPAATPTDAVNLLTGGKLGNLARSRAALAEVGQKAKMTAEEVAQTVINIFLGRLEGSIAEMFLAWEQEPAYRIWELVNKKKVTPERVIGIGAAAEAFVPALAKRLAAQSFVHPYSPVANALGAAVARPTLSLLLHADTRRQVYDLNVEGITGTIGAHAQMTDVKDLAVQHLQEIARQRGIGRYADRYEFFLEEQFNMVRGWSTTGKLFDVGIQIAPGVIDEFKGVLS